MTLIVVSGVAGSEAHIAMEGNMIWQHDPHLGFALAARASRDMRDWKLAVLVTVLVVVGLAFAAEPVMASSLTVTIGEPDVILKFTDIPAPPGTTGISISSFSTIGDPGGLTISDRFDITETLKSSPISFSATFTETSDHEVPGALGVCPIAGCDLIEDGTRLTIFTLLWLDNAGAVLDSITVLFQSDLDVRTGVPEPASLLLLGTGLAGFIGIRWRAWRSRLVANGGQLSARAD